MYTPLARDTPQMADGHCSERYAFYWKAFLFLIQTMNMHEKKFLPAQYTFAEFKIMSPVDRSGK